MKGWKEACEWKGRARVLIPRGTYMVKSVRFEGPCKGQMSLVIKGVLKAPTDPTSFSMDSWINFRYADRLTVSGGGTLDAQGRLAWRFNDCNKDSHCPALPTVTYFFFSFFLSLIFSLYIYI